MSRVKNCSLRFVSFAYLSRGLFPQALGGGFEVFTVGNRRLVRSVPTELNRDHNQIIEAAQVCSMSFRFLHLIIFFPECF